MWAQREASSQPGSDIYTFGRGHSPCPLRLSRLVISGFPQHHLPENEEHKIQVNKKWRKEKCVVTFLSKHVARNWNATALLSCLLRPSVPMILSTILRELMLQGSLH
ncbi:methionine--tRNA ligase [Striga asiatica]|uniref:Methionine--tRNA ligase n=1 Tax=Striga asiatica TaxID=4170 RepID=A0A5A7Q3G6_STRAF|nr:methionine--tRNA ligase [Striga asiatica]